MSYSKHIQERQRQYMEKYSNLVDLIIEIKSMCYYNRPPAFLYHTLPVLYYNHPLWEHFLEIYTNNYYLTENNDRKKTLEFVRLHYGNTTNPTITEILNYVKEMMLFLI